MADALIGVTGFVGSTLAKSRHFDVGFSSRTIGGIDGGVFSTVVCAGVSAVKWLANEEPAADIAAIEGLMAHLATITAMHFILVSTIDVYREPVGVTEADIPPTAGLHPYGLHRLQLEEFVAARFSRCTIIRLPGLFGTNLRKNLIFDMIHGNQTDRIAPGGRLQWYPMRRFADDLTKIAAAAPPLVNVAVEPVETEVIRARLFPDVIIGAADRPAPHYDMHTNQADLLGGSGLYHLDVGTMLAELDQFVASERSSA